MRKLTQFADPASSINFAGSVLLASAMAVLTLGSPMAAAQTTTDKAAPPSASSTRHPHKRTPVKTPAPPVVAPVAPVVAPEPEAPHWPANDQPTPATVTWDSHGLHIDATNSSLAQILHDVSTATGAKVDGFSADQRIFGSYGPGQARDILVQLLQGSGYNVLMVGDQGAGTPRQVLLSSRNGTTAPAPSRPNANGEDEDVDAEEPNPQPVLQPDPQHTNGFPARTPQQIMQEMQQRQQQMGQRNYPQAAPPPQPNYTPPN